MSEPPQPPEFPEPPELPPGLRPRGLRKQPKATSPPLRGAVAGSLLLGAVLACAGVGLGIGALLGAPVPLALVGLFAGFGVGFALVRVRFRDL